MILRDISSRRAAEERHRKLETQLLHTQRMEAIGRLAGGVAHDFNNLLTVIAGYTELLLQELPPAHRLRDAVTTIRDTGDRAASLTSQLLTFSRGQVVASSQFDLNAVVGDFARMLRRLIGDDVELILRLSSSPCPVVADPRQVEQVVMNLVVNARDAMPGGGTLVVETDVVSLGVDGLPLPAGSRGRPIRPAGGDDTGTGMPQEVASRIFEPFFTTKQPGQGTGLGLSTVYGIARQAGGHVDVYSEVGHGTVFKVYLPWRGEQQGEGATALAAASYPTGTEHVLVVEDDPAIREIIVHVLSSRGYQVTATNGAAAAIAHVEAGAAGRSRRVGRDDAGDVGSGDGRGHEPPAPRRTCPVPLGLHGRSDGHHAAAAGPRRVPAEALLVQRAADEGARGAGLAPVVRPPMSLSYLPRMTSQR